MTAEEYLAHCYQIPKVLPNLPLDDEKFLVKWRETQGDAIKFLSKLYGRELTLRGEIKISFAQTLAGKLPVIRYPRRLTASCTKLFYSIAQPTAIFPQKNCR